MTRVGLVAGGLGAYWPQFPKLLPQLQNCARQVAERLSKLDCEVVDAGFVSDAREAAAAAEKLRVAGCDLIVGYLTTYLTATMLMPIAQRSGAPVLVIHLQPSERMDHARFDTGDWLAYCGACSLPEMANAFTRCGIEFRSVSGHLNDERAWDRIERWVAAAGVRAVLRRGRHGLLGHVYPGMMDVVTDPTLVTAHFGGHVEVLEIDDLRVRVEKVTDGETAARVDEARDMFTLDESVAISAGKPMLRGLGVYHGKRGWGVSVELAVAHGPVTTCGLGQLRDGTFKLVASEGEVVDGPLLRIGNTTSRVDFGCDPGEWTDAWSASGVAHHWALGTGHRVAELQAVANLLGIELTVVQP